MCIAQTHFCKESHSKWEKVKNHYKSSSFLLIQVPKHKQLYFLCSLNSCFKQVENMIKALLLWFFLFTYMILTSSAYGSTSTAKIEALRNSKLQKEPNYMSGMIMESSEPLGLHDVQHMKMSQKARQGGGGGGASDIKNPHKGKNSARSCSVKSSSLFMAALRHLIPVMLLVGCFF